MVAAAAMGALLLSGGMTDAAPAGGNLQLTDAIAATSTTTVLTASPVSPVAQGTMVTLTAMVTPATAPGTVQFKDGTVNLGNPVIVSNGTASGTTSKLASGSRQLTAVFTPSDPAAFMTSTSPVVTFLVNAPPKQPTDTRTALTTSPAATVAQGTAVTLIATVSPAMAPGTVQFKDGTADLGTPVTVRDGTASETTLLLPVGSRQLTAVFSPSDPAAFATSSSPVVSLTVTAPTQTITPQQSGQSLDGATVLDARGLTVLDLGGVADGRGLTVLGGQGATVLDGQGTTGGGGLTIVDLGGRPATVLDGQGTTASRGLTVLDGRGLTVLRGGGLLSNLLRGLL